MAAPTIKSCVEAGRVQRSCDVEGRFDQDENKHNSRSVVSVLSVRPQAEPSTIPPAEVADSPQTPLAYARRPGGFHLKFRGARRQSPRLPSNRELLASPKLHAIELKIEGPHLCDLPQDFAARLRAFLKDALGMAPLHMAVGQGCIHLVVMLLEVARGAGPVIFLAHRHRRSRAATAGFGSLPTRLMAFMSEVLPVGSAGAPEHVEIRHSQRSYELNASPAQRQQLSGVEQPGTWQAGRIILAPPQTHSDVTDGAATAVAVADDEYTDLETPLAGVAVAARTDPAGTRAAAIATAATTMRTSAPASSAAAALVLGSSGGTWGSSSAGRPTRSWVAWPVSPGLGATGSNAGGTSQINSDAANGGTSQMVSSAIGGAGPSLRTDGVGGAGADERQSWVKKVATPRGVQQHEGQHGEVATDLAAAAMPSTASSTGSAPPLNISYACHSSQTASQQLHQDGQPLLQRAETVAVLPSQTAGERAQQQPSRVASGSSDVAAQTARSGPASIWVSEPTKDETMEALALKDGYLERMSLDFDGSTNLRRPIKVPYRSWVCEAQVEIDESRVSGSGPRRSRRGNREGAAPSASAVAAVEAALVFGCARADGVASMASAHAAGRPIPGLYDGGAGTDIRGNAFVQRPAKVGTSVGAVATAVAARCNNGSGGGVRSGRMVLRQAARGAASGDTSLASGDGGGNCGIVSGTLTFAALGPTLADRQDPSTVFGPSGWAGTPYPPAARILSPAQVASLNPGHQQAGALATATTNTTSNTVIVRPFGDVGIGLGGLPGNQSSYISGGGSVEIPEALAGLLMPQVPLAVARLHSQSHARAVELLSPAVVVWPPPPPPPPPRAASPEALGTGHATTGVDPGRAVGRGRPGVSRLAPLQSTIQQLAALAPAQTLSPAQPMGELCLVMRCPDVIASVSKGHGRGVNRENPSQRYADGSSSSGGSGSTVNASSSANAISGEDGTRWGCSTDSLWNEANQRDGSGSGTSSSGLGQVSQLVAWSRSGAISLLQVDDSAEGCTRATLMLPLPLPPPLMSTQPDLRPPPSPRPAWERSRAVINAVRSSAEVLLTLGNSGAPGSGSAGGGSSRGASSAPLETRAMGDSPHNAGRGSAGGGSVATATTAATAALGAHLLYVAWRRGQSLGPPCPLLLLPSGLEDVASELQALQPQPAQPPQLPSYQAFISDLGTWLEALHALTSMPWTSPLPSSGTACGNGNVGGGGVSVGIVGVVTGSDGRAYHSLQSSSGYLSGAGTGTGTASGSNAATGVSATSSPAHGEPLTWRFGLGNYGGSPCRAVAPAEHIGSTATVSARLDAATVGPTTAKARNEAAVSGISAAAPAPALPLASELNTELSLDNLAQRGEEQLSPFHAAETLSSAMMMHQPQQPLPPVAGPQPAASAQPLSQGQRVPSASTLFSGSDVPEEKIARFVDEVFCLGCDLLVHAVARGAVATARFIMGRLLGLGPQAACIALLGSNGAAVPTASTTVAVAAAGQSSSTSPSRSVGSTGTRGGGLGLSKLQHAVSSIVSTEVTVAGGSLAVRSALFRAVLDTCRSNSEFGRSLLHLAVLSQSLPMVRLLLEIWPQENGLPASELNRLDKAGLPPAAYLPQVGALGPQACRGVDGSSGAAEFAMAAEPMLLALGRPLPAGDASEAAVDATEVAEEQGRWGLQAVQEGSSEAASIGASGVRIPGAASVGSGFVATGSSGGAEGSTGPAVWEARRFSGGEVGRSISVNILSDGGGSDDGGGTWRRASGGRRLARLEDEPARASLLRPLAGDLGATLSASTAAARDLAGLATSPPGPAALATATAAWPQVSQMDFAHQPGDPARPLLRWALWATVQMLLGSIQALVVLLFAMPRARDLPPSASLLAIPGALLWLPSLCLALTSCLSAATALLPPPWPPFPLLLQPQWQEALPPWLPAAVTSMGRALACVMSLAAAVEVSSARRGIRGGGSGSDGGISEVGAGHGGLLMLMAGGRGMSGAEASIRMLLMTLAPTALEAAYVEPQVRATFLLSEFGLPLMYVMLYDSVPAAVVWLAYSACNVVLGMAVVAVMDLHARASAAAAAAMGGDR
ncbi:hypothetical protein Vafri_11179 [Volvox africanus]|nr:hypothetical protein Vafri_11179 [Volvox africanus]